MRSQPKALSILTIISGILFLGALWMVFFYAPLESVMNYVQKIFYFHVSNAWVGMLGFMAAAVAGIIYLIKKDLKWDLIELSAVEISLVFFFIAILSGSIWAKPSWGTWWTWDSRLTTAAILEMIYLAYLLLRQGIEDVERRARFSAVYTLVGSLSIPLTFISIRIWRLRSSAKNIGTGTAISGGNTPRCAICPDAIIWATIDGGQPVSISPALACHCRFARARQSTTTFLRVAPRTPVTITRAIS